MSTSSLSLPPLLEVLRQVPDPRKRRGRRHPLAALLGLACAAMLCGYRSYSAISEWGRNYDPAFLLALGFTRESAPCAATLFQVFRRLDREELERRLGEWGEQVLAATAPVAGEEALALDGKTLRGSQKQGAPAAHLLSVVSHRLGLTVGQAEVNAKTNEIPVAGLVLEGLLLEGRIFTMDALLTQRALAQQIVAGDGDYVMLAKGNQPTLKQDIATVFTAPPAPGEQRRHAGTQNQGHGRRERRQLTSSDGLAGYLDWPGQQQVFMVEREVVHLRTGEVEQETVYGVTSLEVGRADAERLLQLVRHHWHIENRSHWVRDVTYDEDRSQVRVGSIPRVMAAIRNTVIGLLRVNGATNIAAATRRMAARPAEALALLGISSTFK